MSDFFPLWEDGPLFAQAQHFRLSTDCVLLAHFTSCIRARNGIDLGCASGAIGLLLLEKNERLHMTGLEIVPEAAGLARENMSINGFEERSEIVCGDIRQHRSLFTAGSFDLVVSNPPYYALGSGAVSPDISRAAARSETICTLEDICAAAKFLLKTGGGFSMVYKPERLTDAIRTMSGYCLEPKRLRLVCPSPEKAPSLVLIEARRGGSTGLTIEPSLFLNDSDGNESKEYRKIYHRQELFLS